MVLANEFDERGLIAGAQPRDESVVVVHAVRGYDAMPCPAAYAESRRVSSRA
jgi:hypothetical protein